MSVENFKKFYHLHQDLSAYLIGTLFGIILTFLTQDWRMLFVSAVATGLLGDSNKQGIKYGTSSVVSVYFIYLIYLFLTSPLLGVLNVFIGIIGLSGMGWILLLVILLIAFLIGLTGGYLGASIRVFLVPNK